MRIYLISAGIILFVGITLALPHNIPDLQNKEPTAIEAYISSLPMDDQPVKTILREKDHQAYWLSMLGELHKLSQDTSQYVRLHHAEEAWNDVTFIEDFCVSQSGETIYFTDIMDLKSGMSTIKVSNNSGSKLKTLAHLPQEIPYKIGLSHNEEMLFYLTKKERGNLPLYCLRFINMNDNERGTLYTSNHRLEELHTNAEKVKISVHNSQNKILTFATDLQTIQGIAQAFE